MPISSPYIRSLIQPFIHALLSSFMKPHTLTHMYIHICVYICIHLFTFHITRMPDFGAVTAEYNEAGHVAASSSVFSIKSLLASAFKKAICNSSHYSTSIDQPNPARIRLFWLSNCNFRSHICLQIFSLYTALT